MSHIHASPVPRLQGESVDECKRAQDELPRQRRVAGEAGGVVGRRLSGHAATRAGKAKGAGGSRGGESKAKASGARLGRGDHARSAILANGVSANTHRSQNARVAGRVT